MPKHIDQFAIYSAKIFEELYDSFPIPKYIDKNMLASEYAIFTKSDELRKLSTGRDFGKLIKAVGQEDQKKIANEKLPNIESKIHELERERRHILTLEKDILEGTIDFLVLEGLVRECESGKYQLTSKGFSHLNKSFKDGTIADNETTITAIKRIFLNKGSDAALQSVAGALTIVITRLIDTATRWSYY